MLVQNRQDGQLYVKKRVHSYSPEIYHRLRREPVRNTPRIYEIREESATDGEGCVLTVIEEYIPGCTVSERMAEKGLFTEKEAIEIAIQLCGVLEQLHKMTPAVIHRDIKPSNVMLLPDGTVRLLDFNAAKTETPDQRRDTVLLGTAGFAAPEQYGFSSSTPQTDLYAVGVLINIMLTGTFPWEKITEGRLRRVVGRCLRMDPQKRYAGAWELRRVLCRIRRTRAEWLPPGFRTLHPLKMLAALPVYLFVIAVSLCADRKSGMTAAEYDALRLTLLLLGIAPILFYGNYLDVQRFFPFLRSSRPLVRAAGYALSPLLLMLLILAVSVLLHLLLVR